MEAKLMKIAVANLEALIQAEADGDADPLKIQLLKATLELLKEAKA